MMARLHVQIENAAGRAELDRLQARMRQSQAVRQECETLLDSGVNPFVLVQERPLHRNEVRYRSELSEPFWRILEREAV